MRAWCFVLALALVLSPWRVSAAPDAGAPVPQIVVDPTAGDWVVDRFAGTWYSGLELYQGPAAEAGGLGRPSAVAVASDGRVFLTVLGGLVVEVGTDGVLRLAVGDGGSEAVGAPAAVVGGAVTWNPKENALYLTGPSCIRKLSEHADGTRLVELVAGSPTSAGLADGPLATATLTQPGSLVINSRGTVYFLDGKAYGQCLRKLEDGAVSTLSCKLRNGGYADGPLATATFNLIGLGGNITLGESDDVLYLSDHWNFRARRIDVKAGQVTTVAGMPKPAAGDALEARWNHNSDGPALTHASFNSGCACVHYDAVNRALWVGGPDEDRFRWLAQDGWIRTVIGAHGADSWSSMGQAVPADGVRLIWNAVLAHDTGGAVYLAASSHPTGLWRAHRKGGQP